MLCAGHIGRCGSVETQDRLSISVSHAFAYERYVPDAGESAFAPQPTAAVVWS